MSHSTQALVKSARAPRRPASAPHVETLIHFVRGQKVILDADLAALYDVSTKRLNEAVKRNPKRFPADYLFQLTRKEAENLRSQIATSSGEAQVHGGRRYTPYAFTEHGVVMVSAVLNSERAIRMSVFVVNAFVRIRELVTKSQNLSKRVAKLEQGQHATMSVIESLVEDIERVAIDVAHIKTTPLPKKRRIGFGD